MNKKNTQLNVLYVISLLPCPPEIGVHHRILNIGRQLKNYADVNVVYAGPPVETKRLEATQRQLGPVRVMETPQIRLPGIPDSLVHRFQYHWPWYHADKITRRDRQEFHKLHEAHDLTWFHTLRSADSIGPYRFDHALVDLDDLSQTKYHLMRRTETTMKGKLAAAILTYKWLRWEQKARDRFSWLAVCSDSDAAILGNPRRTIVIPNGCLRPDKEPVWHDRTEKMLGFMGFLGYTPNRRGLEWFCRAVWPNILQRIPQARLRVMGHLPDVSPFRNRDRVHLLGYVEDAAAEMNTWNAMIVPLQYGGGTRLKILDAFSKKCPVISTRIGAYGLNVRHEENILLADLSEGFADQCIRLMNEPALGQTLAESGWKLFTEQYTWDTIGQRIETFLVQFTEDRKKTDSQDFRRAFFSL